MSLLIRLTLLVFSMGSLVIMAATDDTRLHLLVFGSDTCPHCQAQKPFLDSLTETHAGLTVDRFELQRDAAGLARLRTVAAAHGVAADSVPAVFVGGRAWIGDSVMIRNQISSHVEHCLAQGNCPDSRDTDPRPDGTVTTPGPNAIDVPWFGIIDLNMQPVTLSTVLIAFVDGFNPCSLWVLTMLLALVIHSASRLRILAVGLTFLTVTSLIYGMFITGVFGALNLMLMASWIYPIVALFALVFAVVNIKDYFWYQRGVSFTIDEKHKPGMYRRFRGLVAERRSMPALIGATALMAAGIAIIELPCTAGFPVVWSGIVSGQNVEPAFFAFLLGLYLLIYFADELVIFVIALATFHVGRFQERHGRILKLIGGMIMLTLAAVLMLAPHLMRDAGGALAVFAAALGITILILFLHRYLLPRLGLKLGDEK